VFEAMLERLRLKEFNVLLVYMLDRFSRQKPTQIVSDLHKITDTYGARFISLREAIDSSQAMWEVIMMIFAFMANNSSKMLGIRVREGIQAKKAKNEYHGGRPAKRVDADRLRMLMNGGKPSLRKLAAVYNAELPKAQRVSYQTIRKTLVAM
jgi:DNA invertase Pin-like site-specific DNA recombinase